MIIQARECSHSSIFTLMIFSHGHDVTIILILLHNVHKDTDPAVEGTIANNKKKSRYNTAVRIHLPSTTNSMPRNVTLASRCFCMHLQCCLIDRSTTVYQRQKHCTTTKFHILRDERDLTTRDQTLQIL